MQISLATGHHSLRVVLTGMSLNGRGHRLRTCEKCRLRGLPQSQQLWAWGSATCSPEEVDSEAHSWGHRFRIEVWGGARGPLKTKDSKMRSVEAREGEG